MKRLVFGVTGQPSSGKDTVAEHIESHGFLHIPTANLIREEMRKQGIEVDRAHTSAFVIEKRKERGPGYLAEEAVKRISGNAVVSGLRNVVEVEVLRKAFGKECILIAVEAPIETRYKWGTSRGRVGDSISFEQFKHEEEVEKKGNANAQQVDAVISMADKIILNDGTKEELLQKVNDLIATLDKPSL